MPDVCTLSNITNKGHNAEHLNLQYFLSVTSKTRQITKVAVTLYWMLTLSSPVMPFGIILLILFFICYNLGGWKGLNLSSTKKS
jgi:hypothetical protein